MASSASRPRRSRQAASAAAPVATARRSRTAVADGQPVFHPRNYTLLGIGLALIVVGYTVMRMENEVDGFLSLYVSPLLLLAGYLGMIYAILWRPRRTTNAPLVPAVDTSDAAE